MLIPLHLLSDVNAEDIRTTSSYNCRSAERKLFYSCSQLVEYTTLKHLFCIFCMSYISL